MKILIASDSYKGSLSTLQVAEKIKEGVLRVYPKAEIKSLSVADGGEGTVNAVISSLGGRIEKISVTGPDGKRVNASYGILNDGKAVIEMAAASGLPLVDENKKDVMKATTYGTGELIRAAMDQGCQKIYVGVGGSATNDGGVGMAQALGISFQDYTGKEIGFGGEQLMRIADINLQNRDIRLDETEIIVMSDVKNLLCGSDGAAVVYGPQKGASQEQIKLLDVGLAHLSRLVQEKVGINIQTLPGAGAAGGLGGGLVAFAGAKIQSGIEAILDMAGFEEKVQWADLIITGEGRIDFQSAYGKVISGIANRANRNSVPVVAIVGSISHGAKELYKKGITSMESAVCRPMELKEAMGNGAGDMVADAAERLMKSIQLGNNMVIKCKENVETAQ